MKKVPFLSLLLLFFWHSTSSLTPHMCRQAYKAYSPYKESFRFFWYALSEEQRKMLHKALLDHATIYVASKQKNGSILAQKKINTGVLITLSIPSLITLLTGLVIIYLKDYHIASRQNRARCAGLGGAAIVGFILYGLQKIYKGITYEKHLEQRITRDQILLEEIEKYEQAKSLSNDVRPLYKEQFDL